MHVYTLQNHQQCEFIVYTGSPNSPNPCHVPRKQLSALIWVFIK